MEIWGIRPKYGAYAHAPRLYLQLAERSSIPPHSGTATGGNAVVAADPNRGSEWHERRDAGLRFEFGSGSASVHAVVVSSFENGLT